MVFPLAALPVGSHALYLTRGPLEPALCSGMLCLLCALSVNCKQLSQGTRVKVYKYLMLSWPLSKSPSGGVPSPADDSSVPVLGGVGA